jgi:hypothetical protein
MEVILDEPNLRSDTISDWLKKAEKEGVEEVRFIWRPRYLAAEVSFSIKLQQKNNRL